MINQLPVDQALGAARCELRRYAIAVLLSLMVRAADGNPPATAAATDLPSQSAALTADPAHGLILYRKHCMGCHGARAWGDGPREIPALAGQQKSYLLEQLENFVSGVRTGSEMHGPAMHEALGPPDLNRPQALSDLAAYLARAVPNTHPESGEGRPLALGRSAYRRACAGCHGASGTGSETRAPRIAGQHASYLLSRLRNFASIHHGQPGPPPEQQQAIADYVSRLAAGATADR